MKGLDPVRLSLFSQRINAVCEEMGAQLKHSAFSPNIRDRLDYSCAVFDRQGELVAQAAHIPVHLGSMAHAMKQVVSGFEWLEGDQVIFNDPYLGGTHLPDVTLVAPVFSGSRRLVGFVANRAHYADIGSTAPGSMPLTTLLDDEGLLLAPQKIVAQGIRDDQRIMTIARETRGISDTLGDINAQIGCNSRGAERLGALIGMMGIAAYREAVESLNDYAESLAKTVVSRLEKGEFSATDVMEDDGQGNRDIAISSTLKIGDTGIEVDFQGTSAQVPGNINCPFSVTVAAVWYVLRCLMPPQTPACAGCFRPVRIKVPEKSLVNASYPAAVAAGNVETSTRIVDVLMTALAQAAKGLVPALSQGTMNNIAFGSNDPAVKWGYYETIGGGMGANARYRGLDAIQSHMTNTRNTPVEVLEMRYPLRVRRYQIRSGSGGQGRHRGGDGIIREFEFRQAAVCTLLTERRRYEIPGLQGGLAGEGGENLLNGKVLPGKCSVMVSAGDRITVCTPGGGGWGKPA